MVELAPAHRPVSIQPACARPVASVGRVDPHFADPWPNQRGQPSAQQAPQMSSPSRLPVLHTTFGDMSQEKLYRTGSETRPDAWWLAPHHLEMLASVLTPTGICRVPWWAEWCSSGQFCILRLCA